MDSTSREWVREVLAEAGVRTARRAIPLDPTEEVILLAPDDLSRVDVDALARRLMDVLPHTKVWVAQDAPGWDSEAL